MELQEYLPQNIAGKNILVSGGSTGIGRAIVVLLAQAGANVLFFGHNQDHVTDALADAKNAATGRVEGFVGNTATQDGIAHIFKQVDAFSGTIDVLVNNAAVGYGNVTEGGYTDWQQVVNINLLGYMACTAGALERMLKTGSGHIVNIGSMSADRREETGSVYVATKAGIQAYSEALRKDVNKHGIKVTLIEPGAVDTDMQQQPTADKLKEVQQGMMLMATDVAVAVLYALSQPKRCDIAELKIKPLKQFI